MSSNHSLSPLIKSLTLLEISRHKKELGVKPTPWQEQLAALEQQNKTDKNLFVHFSDYPRMGLYLKNQYKTPIGFYAYFLDRKKMMRFATSRPSAVVIRPKPTARLLDFMTYSAENLKQDVEKLAAWGFSQKMIEYARRGARDNQNLHGSMIWNITRLLAGADSVDPDFQPAAPKKDRGGGPTGKWSYLLWKVLGYDGVVDDGFQIIHHLEPNQAVFFNTTQVEIVSVVEKKDESSILDAPKGSILSLFEKDKKLLDFQGSDFRNMVNKQILKAIGFSENNMIIEGVDFSGSDFTGANLQRINFINCRFAKADLSKIELYKSLFTRCLLGGAKIREAKMDNCGFVQCVLNSADLFATNLRNSRFSGVHLRNAYLQDVDFFGAAFYDVDFTGSNLEDAIGLREATFDAKTKLPKGFDLATRKMIAVP